MSSMQGASSIRQAHIKQACSEAQRGGYSSLACFIVNALHLTGTTGLPSDKAPILLMHSFIPICWQQSCITLLSPSHLQKGPSCAVALMALSGSLCAS